MAPDNLQSQSEQEIQFKKRARRRLVGAIALVLLMIVILPMLLQDKVQQAANEVVISIPGQDSQLEAKPNSEPVQIPDAVQSSNNLTPETSMPDSEASVSASLAQSTASSNAQVSTPTTLPAVETKQQATAAAVLPGDKPKTVTASDSTSFIIQIGVFSAPDKVKQLQVKLSEKGLKSRADLVDTSKGKKTRLRVGSFSSKSDAEAALLKVKSLGFSDAVIGNE